MQQPEKGARGTSESKADPPKTTFGARREETYSGLPRTLSLPTGWKTTRAVRQLTMSRQGGRRARGTTVFNPADRHWQRSAVKWENCTLSRVEVLMPAHHPRIPLPADGHHSQRMSEQIATRERRKWGRLNLGDSAVVRVDRAPAGRCRKAPGCRVHGRQNATRSDAAGGGLGDRSQHRSPPRRSGTMVRCHVHAPYWAFRLR